MKNISIDLVDNCAEDASQVQATNHSFSLTIKAEQVKTPADFIRLKELVTNAEILFSKELSQV